MARVAKPKPNAVLFVNIGLSDKYDKTTVGGKSNLTGNFKYFRTRAAKIRGISEQALFVESKKSREHHCGLGFGQIREAQGKLNVVFVTLDRKRGARVAVAIFRDVRWSNGRRYPGGTWILGRSSNVRCFKSPSKRPTVQGWVDGRNLRRWAVRYSRGNAWDTLRKLYFKLERRSSR